MTSNEIDFFEFLHEGRSFIVVQRVVVSVLGFIRVNIMMVRTVHPRAYVNGSCYVEFFFGRVILTYFDC